MRYSHGMVLPIYKKLRCDQMDDILLLMLLSIKVSVLATIIISVVGTAIAYFLARNDFRGKNPLVFG